ncbi:MAG: multiheme c-type cytochrome [Lysobacterales bacterium]|jgi:hypothetical protein
MKAVMTGKNRWGGAGRWLAALALLAGSGCLFAQYEGAEYCVDCHDQQYYQWITSGHRFILMEAPDARHRKLPLPDGQLWNDFTYVIGGNKTKALYLDLEGYLYTPQGGDNQFNILTGEWSDYRAGENAATYDCGACHTTGYESGGFPTNLPGISGTFALPGVQCEHCHGPGNTMNEGDPAICADCHNHGPASAVKASGGFIVSEGQYNEFMAGPHSGLSKGCVSCHNPHEQASTGIKVQCQSCHGSEASAYQNTLMSKVGVECKDCHMPPATLSAQALGPHKGDMRSHIFYINTDPAANMFTPDGSNVQLNGGKGAVTLDFVCQRCHQGASLDELARFAKDFHNPNKTLADFGLNPGLTGTWWNSERSGEGFLLQFGNAAGALTLFASFYTYDPEGNQVWLVAQSTSIDGIDANVAVYVTSGRKWGDDFNPADGETVQWGDGVFSFADCSSGSVLLVPNATYEAMGFSQLEYDLTRDDFPVASAIDCPSFANSTE